MRNMDQRPQYKIWWLLKEIKAKLLEDPNKTRVNLLINIMANEPSVPYFKDIEEIIFDLRANNLIRASKYSPEGYIGVDGYVIEPLQPKFDELYSKYEQVFSMDKISSDTNKFDFSNEIKEKISHILNTVILKLELDNNLNDNKDQLIKIDIPHQDFLTHTISKSDVLKTLQILGKELDFVPYFHRGPNIEIDFNPHYSAERIIALLRAAKNSIRSPNISEHVEKKVLEKKNLPANTRWQDIAIRFLNNHEAIIKIKDESRHTRFDEMGFKDKRTGLPDKQWDLMVQLSKHKGEVSWENNRRLSKKDIDAIKKRKQLLANTLRAYFGIDEDPFYSYKEEKAYKIKINLVPEVDSYDQDTKENNKDDLGLGDYLREQAPEVYDEYE